MFLEEKPDLLKKRFQSEDLKIPFSSHVEIMRKIEARLINKSDPNSLFNGWMVQLKNVKEIIPFEGNINDWLISMLDPEQNYWWVFVEGKRTTDRHRLLDAKPYTGIHVSYLFYHSCFYVIDKKYKW